MPSGNVALSCRFSSVETWIEHDNGAPSGVFESSASVTVNGNDPAVVENPVIDVDGPLEFVSERKLGPVRSQVYLPDPPAAESGIVAGIPRTASTGHAGVPVMVNGGNAETT